MSYILDALQKNATEAKPAPPTEKFPGITATTPGAPPEAATGGGLSLPWKLAIGAVLLANVSLVYLWRTEQPGSAELLQSAPATSTRQQPAFANTPSGSRGRIPLPGIVSPRDLPPPSAAGNRAAGADTTAAVSTVSSGTGRTFKPTGRPITIAGEPDPDTEIYRPTPAQTTGSSSQTTGRVIPQQPAAPRPSNRARNASALSSLSGSAREALHALSFSFHIYGNESDLRSVVVNGQRITEGKSVDTDSGKTFTIAEITDGGAIIEFEHEGETISVAIPVMEDWKDS